MSHKQKSPNSSSIPCTQHEPSSSRSVDASLSGSGTDNLNSSGSSKAKVQKFCGVCHDRAKSFHFGGLACDSCKAFFRRSVHNDAYASFQCSYKSACLITKNTRKGCQKCRFEKCLRIGMEMKWVMSEQERNALNKLRQERKQNDPTRSPSTTKDCGGGGIQTSPKVTSPIEYIPDVDDMLNFMTLEEQECIQQIVENYRIAYDEIPYKVSEGKDQRTKPEVIEMFTTILQRFAYFSNLIPDFSRLCDEDKEKLLKVGVLEMCLLRSALCFDIENHRWPNTSFEFLKSCPKLRVEDMQDLISGNLFEEHMKFIFQMQKLQVDEPTVMLLLLIVLFYSERSGIKNVDSVDLAQEKYLLLLEKYVQWRYGPEHSFLLYPKLLTKLTNLRQLHDLHTKHNLNISKSDKNTIKENLSNLEIDINTFLQLENEEGLEEESHQNVPLSEPNSTTSYPTFPLLHEVTPSMSLPSLNSQQNVRSTSHELCKTIPTVLEDPLVPIFSLGGIEKAEAYIDGPQAAEIREFFSNRPLHSRYQPQGAPVYSMGYAYPEMGSDRAQSTTEFSRTNTYTVIQSPSRPLVGTASRRHELEIMSIRTEEGAISAFYRNEEEENARRFAGQETNPRAQFQGYVHNSQEIVVERSLEEEEGQSRREWPTTTTTTSSLGVGSLHQSPTRRQHQDELSRTFLS